MALGPFYHPYSYGPPAAVPPLPLAEEIKRDLGEEGLESARHTYRIRGLRAFAGDLVHRKHKKGGSEAAQRFYERVAAYGDPHHGIPEFESLQGFQRLATELFGEPEAKNHALPYLLNGRARPIPGADPEPDQ